jgi:DNA invertase Pin-like site-specific DNA recombinase
MSPSLLALNLQDKQTIVDLLMDVQAGTVSCRRAATEISKQVPKKRLTKTERDSVRKCRANGEKVGLIARIYDINPATVWRICKEKT